MIDSVQELTHGLAMHQIRYMRGAFVGMDIAYGAVSVSFVVVSLQFVRHRQLLLIFYTYITFVVIIVITV